jgi:flagellar export protein FliJ
VKAYRFRLESVLRVRQLQEHAAAQRVAVAVRALHEAHTELLRAQRSLEGLTAPVGRLSAGEVAWVHEQSDRMAEHRRQRADEVRAAEEAARQARDLWGSARQRTATLERLDTRHLALWRTEFDRSEAAALDDLATRRMPGEISPS